MSHIEISREYLRSLELDLGKVEDELARFRAACDAWLRYINHHEKPSQSDKESEILGWMRRDRFLYDQAIKKMAFAYGEPYREECTQ